MAAAAGKEPQDQYVVTGHLAVLKTSTPDGLRLKYFYKGAPVPGDVAADQIEHHLKVGLIAKAGGDDKKPAGG
jgi:hypothetical protein